MSAQNVEVVVQMIRDRAGALRAEAVGRAVAACLRQIGLSGDLVAAGSAGRAAAKSVLLSRDALAALLGAEVTDPRRAAIDLAFDSLWGPIRLARPPRERRASAISCGAAALGGAVIFGLAGGAVMRLLLDLRETGLFAGACLGAAVGGWLGVRWASRRAIPALAAAPSTADVARGVDEAFGDGVRAACEQWVDGALLCVAVLGRRRIDEPETDVFEQSRELLAELGARLVSLHRSAAVDLPVAVDELLVEARRLGFGGLEGPAAFHGAGPAARSTTTWSTEMATRYATFGAVERGDAVIVEREPVEFDGRVLEKGLVRRQRGSAEGTS